jgi:hypothetical protein
VKTVLKSSLVRLFSLVDLFRIELILLVHSLVAFLATSGFSGQVMIYNGASDASAAVAVGDDMFIVADDENNILRAYSVEKGGSPIFSYDLTDFLGVEREHSEADIEGVTRVADRVYWITSHGRNKDGKIRPNRYRFFATSVKSEGGNIAIRPVGVPYRSLVHMLVGTDSMHGLGLSEATRFNEKDLPKKQREKLAPKEQGLNIEGLCAAPEGKTLFIGFRNPRPFDKSLKRNMALVVPLENPQAVVEQGDTPMFGKPILWDLAGLGIRAMEYSHFHKAYFVIAGTHDDHSDFALYRWSGKRDETPVFLQKLTMLPDRFTPETIICFEKSPRLLLLSDDGSIPVKVSDESECMEGELRDDGTCLNKHLANPAKKTFRAIWLQP